MKLSKTQIMQARDQIQAIPVPDNHPLVDQLTEIYGTHTFFLDNDGLEIIESAESGESEFTAARSATVVKLARWADDMRTTLAPHTPIPTQTRVNFSADGGGPAI